MDFATKYSDRERKKNHRKVYNKISYGKRNWFFFGTVPIVDGIFVIDLKDAGTLHHAQHANKQP